MVLDPHRLVFQVEGVKGSTSHPWPASVLISTPKAPPCDTRGLGSPGLHSDLFRPFKGESFLSTGREWGQGLHCLDRLPDSSPRCSRWDFFFLLRLGNQVLATGLE